ncbi:MAG: OPT/YSL family transporter [Phycisphaerales bacterium]|nr:MAG: OPT/YSL family transporter [Phycisphaerales bacterium]
MNTPEHSDSLPPAEIPALPPDATPEQKDHHWHTYVYQGDRMPQLTLRAVLMGGILGMAMAAANLYTTLAIGWGFGIAITACVISYVIWTAVRAISGNSISQMSVLENACMASTASAAGYSTGSTIATMFGALVLLKDPGPGQTLEDITTLGVSPWWVVGLFTLCTGLMGVFLAIPMKRQMINQEQLPFPSGTAAAETLRSLYSQSKEAVRKAYVLVAGLAGGLLIGFLRAPQDVVDKVPILTKFFGLFGGHAPIPSEVPVGWFNCMYATSATPKGRHPYGAAVEPSALLIAAGMIVGPRISTSMLIGSLLLYGVVGPKMAAMDADHLEPGATAVHAAVLTQKSTLTDPATAADSIVNAIIAAAGDPKIGVTFTEEQLKSFRSAGDDARKAVLDEAKKAAESNPSAPAAKPEELAEAQINAVVKAIDDAAVPVAADAFAELPAKKAKADAIAAAKARGDTDDKASMAGDIAYQDAKYRKNFTWWSWFGHENNFNMLRWALWGGTALMVFSSLMSIALQWKTFVRAFKGARAGSTPGAVDMSDIEVPGSWMVIGMLPITIAMVWLQVQAFGVSWWAGVIAVAMSFVLSLVASRATGETDTTPIGAMGKVMQLMFAVLAPKNISANLASAGIAANSASSSADLLTDLKTGYLLGANPRKQFIAQFLGVFFGTLAIVPIWYLMVPDRAKLESFAMPATRAWEAVARVLVEGVSELPPSAITSIFVGAAIGCLLPIVEKFLPAKAKRFMPSAMGLGLSWVIPFQNALSFFIGAMIAEIWRLLSPKSQEHYNVPVASGLVAGESMMLAFLAISATVVGLIWG